MTFRSSPTVFKWLVAMLCIAFISPAFAQTQAAASQPGAAQVQLQAAMVSLDQARDALASGSAVVFDIRERDEHARGVIAGTALLPMSQLSQRVKELSVAGDKPVYLICNTQNRSQRTVAALQRAGYTNVHWVNGGTTEWVKRGWQMIAPAPVAPASAPRP
jgi:rhodanese-related sulfurtransferase